MGKVYLIGGGPGSPDLITLKAIKVLRECTAILYDRLSGSEILKYVNTDAKLYYCGKEPGCHYKTQEEINNILIKLAKEGHIVGRIKGGDPYIFGRGGEEALALIDENIDFEVVPGITSPIAALNYGGIPVTHRKIAQSFHVFTAKSAAGLNLDFETIAKLKGTLIFMMGYEQLGGICNGLITAGLGEETPVALVMSGTTSNQKKAVGTLKDITEIAKEKGISNPSIIVVGEVVKFNDKLNWFEKLPLFGRNICNGVEMLFNALRHNNIDIRKIKGEFVSIGDATTKALKDKGIIPTLTAKEFTGEGLFKAIELKVSSGDKILIPRSKKGRDYIVNELRNIGAEVDDIPVYDTVIGENPNLISFESCDTVVFTSPSTVENMITLVGIDKIKEKSIISIGPITSKALNIHQLSYTQCDKIGTQGIIDTLIK